MFDTKSTRSKATRKAYHARARQLFLAAERALKTSEDEPFSVEAQASRVVMWFLSQDAIWRANTIRANRAALREVLEILCRKRPHDQDARAALNLLNETKGPTARKGGEPRTSARKRKALTPEEAAAIIRVLRDSPHRHALLAAHMLRFGTEFGLRPSEWQHARIVGAFLIVPNGKASNGRGNGAWRGLGLAECSEAEVADLAGFLAALADALAKEAWETVYAAMRAQLRAASVKAAKLVPSLRGRPAAFYTGRHVATARAKRVMSPAEVAAFLGHATDRTNRVHYARTKSARGWAPPRVSPDPAQVDTVIVRFRERKDPGSAASSTPAPSL